MIWIIAVYMKICNLHEYLQFYMNIGIFPSLVGAVLHEYLLAVPQASSYRVQPPPNEKSPPVFWLWKGRFSQFLPVQRNTLFSYFRAILHSEYLLYGPRPQLPCEAPSVGFSYNCSAGEYHKSGANSTEWSKTPNLHFPHTSLIQMKFHYLDVNLKVVFY